MSSRGDCGEYKDSSSLKSNLQAATNIHPGSLPTATRAESGPGQCAVDCAGGRKLDGRVLREGWRTVISTEWGDGWKRGCGIYVLRLADDASGCQGDSRAHGCVDIGHCQRIVVRKEDCSQGSSDEYGPDDLVLDSVSSPPRGAVPDCRDGIPRDLRSWDALRPCGHFQTKSDCVAG
jgi:hypothetical protein